MKQSITIVVLAALLATGCTKQGGYISQSQFAGHGLRPETYVCEQTCRAQHPTYDPYADCVATCPDMVFRPIRCGAPAELLCVSASEYDGSRTTKVAGGVAAYLAVAVLLTFALLAAGLGAAGLH